MTNDSNKSVTPTSPPLRSQDGPEAPPRREPDVAKEHLPADTVKHPIQQQVRPLTSPINADADPDVFLQKEQTRKVEEFKNDLLHEPVKARCPSCGYDIGSLLERDDHRCPECGHEWSIEELADQHISHLRKTSRIAWFCWVAIPVWPALLCLGLFLATGMPIQLGFLAVAVVIVCGAVIHWWEMLSNLAAARAAHQGARRIAWILGWIAIFLVINALQVGIFALFVVHAVRSSGSI